LQPQDHAYTGVKAMRSQYRLECTDVSFGMSRYDSLSLSHIDIIINIISAMQDVMSKSIV